MSTYVFLGPTMPLEEARALLPQAQFLPPVKARDVRRLMNRSDAPTVIGIIDGFYEQVASVWHKEILHAMSCGVRVYGGSSMGALRAAELAPFGMIGVGKIFEAYHAGVYEDDDEVSLNHAPRDMGYRALSVAMVNVREALAIAAEEGVITPTTREAVTDVAKAQFYAERCWPIIIQQAAKRGVEGSQLSALRAHVKERPVDVKRDDAIRLLQRMALDGQRDLGAFEPAFAFESPVHWEAMASSIVAQS